MIVLDTTVLVYAVGADHPLREPCRRLVQHIADLEVRATTTVEVIQEFTHVRARRRPRGDAAEVAGEYLQLLHPLLRPTEDDLRSGLHLFSTGAEIGAFDAVLAATVLNRAHLTALVSADQAFGTVDGLVHVDPAEPGAIDRLLATS